MSRIRSKDTKPELIVRKFLFKNGFRYRLHVKDLPGKPDIVLPKYKTAIFVNGCFWHGHKSCKFGDNVKTPSIVISKKIHDSILRDNRNEVSLKNLGWKVITIWDKCELEYRRKNSINRDVILDSLIKSILYSNGNTCN